jgi:hypothetical protein
MSADYISSGMPPEKPSNGLGVAGFVVSLVGLIFTCGVLCPIGLILSLFGLRKEPKGLAIAGAVIGGLGTVFLVLVGAGFAATYLGFKKIAEKSGGDVPTTLTMTMAVATINQHRADKGGLPDEENGNALIAPFKDSAGRALRYERRDAGFVVRGVGKDGKFDTPDDVEMDSSFPEKLK